MKPRIIRSVGALIAALALLVTMPALAGLHALEAAEAQAITVVELNRRLHVGDVVFIQVTPLPFRMVSVATQSWVNHVGVVMDVSGGEATVAESTFPLSRTTPISKFVNRSENGRVAVARLDLSISDDQAREVSAASKARLGTAYDTGFNLHSRGQFCSRFVREVLTDATGVTLGEVESFRTLLARNPQTSLTFWRFWFLGSIPWERETVTPASLYRSERLRRVFDGYAI